MYALGKIYGFSKPDVHDEIVVVVCIGTKPLRFLRLNKHLDQVVSAYVNDLQESYPMQLGGPDLNDKFFYLHKIGSLSLATKFNKNLYCGGNLAEVKILSQNNKLGQSFIRFYLGCYEPKETESLQLKYLGFLSVDEVFTPMENLSSYWNKIYADHLIDTSIIINAENVPQENINKINFDKQLVNSKLWLRPWLILSILMNAISLINIGIDLKLVAPKWLSFMKFALDFMEKLASFLTTPFQWIFDFWSLQIPNIVSSTCFLLLIVFGSLRQASKESDRFFRGNAYSKTYARLKNKHLIHGLDLLTSYSLGYIIGIIYAGIMWLCMSINEDVIPVIFIVLLFVLVILILTYKGVGIKDKYAFKVFSFYIKSVVFLVILLSFINYWGLQIIS